MARHYIEKRHVQRLRGLFYRTLANENLIDRRIDFFRVDANARATVSLGVDVDQERRMFGGGKKRGKVYGCGRLAHTALLVGHSNYFTHTIFTTCCWSRGADAPRDAGATESPPQRSSDGAENSPAPRSGVDRHRLPG